MEWIKLKIDSEWRMEIIKKIPPHAGRRKIITPIHGMAKDNDNSHTWDGKNDTINGFHSKMI